MHDLLIENALIVDGTGSEPVHGNIAVSDGVITHITEGKSGGENAQKYIDANGLVGASSSPAASTPVVAT